MDLQAMTLAPTVSPQVKRLSQSRLAEELSVAPIGRRVAIARRASRTTLRLLLCETHPLIVRALLFNPRLVEDDVVVLAASTEVEVEALQAIASHPNWCDRCQVKRALLSNSRTPIQVALQMVQRMGREELELLSPRVAFPAIVRIAVERRLSPPVPTGAL